MNQDSKTELPQKIFDGFSIDEFNIWDKSASQDYNRYIQIVTDTKKMFVDPVSKILEEVTVDHDDTEELLYVLAAFTIFFARYGQGEGEGALTFYLDRLSEGKNLEGFDLGGHGVTVDTSGKTHEDETEIKTKKNLLARAIFEEITSNKKALEAAEDLEKKSVEFAEKHFPSREEDFGYAHWITYCWQNGSDDLSHLGRAILHLLR